MSIFTVHVLTKSIILLNQTRKGPSMLGLVREIVSKNCSVTLHPSYMVQTLTISNKFSEM